MNQVFADIFSAIRIRQWIKNVLLLAAPLGAAVQPTFSNLSIILKGLATFCLVSSIGYILNDWIDKEHDQTHARKKLRPFATGRLNGFHASLIILILACCTYLSMLNLPKSFLILVGAYGVSTISYSLSFKRIPVVELLSVAFGFLVRCLAGAALFEVYVSKWFLIVTGFGSLFLISSKRLAELKRYDDNQTRLVLTSYSEQFLNNVISISIAITIMAYALWAFEVVGDSIWGKLSILPVLLGVLRYLWHAESDDAESPERAIISDPVIPVAGVITTFLLILAIYK
jgi:decaprenyl-phosphate phosphoribosyltransferase